MVSDTRGARAVRTAGRLNEPRPARVEANFDGTPWQVNHQPVAVVREEWGIENHVHWQLDVVFREDVCRSRKDNAPRNLAVLRHLALNILRAHPAKDSLNTKRQRAAWNEAFLLQLVTHMQ